MKYLMLIAALMLSGCSEDKVVYLDQEGKVVSPPAPAIDNWDDRLDRIVCVHGHQYAVYWSGYAGFTFPLYDPSVNNGAVLTC